MNYSRGRLAVAAALVVAGGWWSASMAQNAAPAQAGTPATGQPDVQAAPQAPASQPKASGKFSCKETTYDFGEVWAGVKIDHTFIIRNEGTDPLELIKVQPSCGCTLANHDKIIEPGKEGKIQASVDTTNFRDMISKTIMVQTSDPTNANVTLTIKGTVKRPVTIDPMTGVNFARVGPEITDTTRTVTITNNTDGHMKLERVPAPQEESVFTAEVKEIQAGKVYEVVVGYKKPLREGANFGQLRFNTGLEKEPQVLIPCRLFAPPLIEVSPMAVTLTEVPKDVQVRPVKLLYTGEGQMKIKSATSSHPGVKTTVKPDADGRSYTVDVELPAGFDPPPGKSVEVVIATDVEQRPQVVVPIRLFKSVNPALLPTPQAPAPTVEADTLVGRPAPTHTVKLINGQELPVGAGHTGERITVLNFWTSWSHESREQVPMVQQIANLYQRRGVEFVTINADSVRPIKEIQASAEGLGLRLRIGLDPKGEMARKYGVVRVPTLFVIGPNGVVEAVQRGSRPGLSDDLQKQLDALLAGRSRDSFGTEPSIGAQAELDHLLQPPATDAAPPAIVLESRAQHIGSFKPGAAVNYTLYYRNDGLQPLNITEVKSPTGLKFGTDFARVVAPAATGSINLSFTTPTTPGPFSHQLELRTNDPRNQVVTVTLVAMTLPYVQVDPVTGVKFLHRPAQHGMPSLATLIYNGEGSVTYGKVSSSSPKFEAEVKLIQQGPNAMVVVKPKPPFEVGQHEAVITVETSSPQQPVVKVPVHLTIPPRIQVEPSVINLTKNSRVQRRSVAIVNNGQQSLNILGVSSSNQGIRTQFYPDTDGMSYRMEISFLPNYVPSAQGDSITIRTDDKEHAEIVIRIQQTGAEAGPAVSQGPAPRR